MRLPWKIVRNPKLPKIERKLDLQHFSTFKNGVNLYTYRVEDLVHISGRYLDQVKSTVNFMIQYNAGPDQVAAFCRNMQDIAKQGIDGKMDRLDALIKAHQYAGEMPKLKDYVESLELKMWYSLYQMFFVIDGEDEMLFSPKYNDMKVKYLEEEDDQELEAKVFFFLKALMISLSDTYREDTLASMAQEGQMMDLVASLTSLTQMQSSLFRQPDTSESTSTPTSTSPSEHATT